MRSRDYDVVLVEPYLTGGMQQATATLIDDVQGAAAARLHDRADRARRAAPPATSGTTS